MKELWDENEGWKWHLFEELMPQETLKKITTISINPNELEDDCLIWNPTGNRACMFKFVLSFIRQEVNGSDEPIWKFIWKMKTRQRVKFFLWLATHDRLMTNFNRFTRGVASDPSCKCCPFTSEDTNHILRNCVHARRIWRNLIPIRNKAFSSLCHTESGWYITRKEAPLLTPIGP